MVPSYSARARVVRGFLCGTPWGARGGSRFGMGPRLGTVKFCLTGTAGLELAAVLRAGGALTGGFPLAAVGGLAGRAASLASLVMRLDIVDPVPFFNTFRNPLFFSDVALDDGALGSSFVDLLDSSLDIEGCLFLGTSLLDVDAGGEAGILGRFWFADNSGLRRGKGTCLDLSKVSLRATGETGPCFRRLEDASSRVSSEAPSRRKVVGDFGGGTGLSSSLSLSDMGVSSAEFSLSESSMCSTNRGSSLSSSGRAISVLLNLFLLTR